MQNKLNKNLLKRNYLKLNEVLNIFIKNLICYVSLFLKISKIYIYIFYFKNIQNISLNSKSKIKNLCILTHRSRSNHRVFNISRLQIRKLGLAGYIPGLRKSSW